MNVESEANEKNVAVDRVVIPKVGDLIKWTEPDYEWGGEHEMISDIIEVNGNLWVNGCGSFDTISKNYPYEVIEV